MDIQMLRRLGEMLLLQWAWIKTWIDLITNGITVFQHFPETDARCTAPVIVILVGIILTNVIGFIHFYRQGCFKEALAAAVDLDTPYLACKLYPEVLRGDNSPDWEKLRLRNSIWRSLPLAVTTFVLASRVVVEIPLCQQFATIGPLAVGAFPNLAGDSPFVIDLLHDGVNPFDLRIFQSVLNHTDTFPITLLPGLRKVAKHSLVLQRRAWEAAHCRESKWKNVALPYARDSDRWFLGASYGLLDENSLEFGGIGSGSMCSLNYLTHQKWELMIQQEDSKELFYLADKYARKHTLQKMGRSKEDRLSEQELRYQTVQQYRPWTLDVGMFLLQVNAGWKVRMLQTFGLLLVAVLPVLTKILSVSCTRAPIAICLVAVYTAFDLMCLVGVFVLCASAPVASHLGTVGDALSEAIFQIASFQPTLLLRWPSDFGKVLITTSGPVIDEVLANLIPALQWSFLFFLKLAAGSFLFLAISSILACVLCGVSAISSLPVGVCGPLWLLSEESGHERSHVFEKEGSKRLHSLMISRSLLFAATVGLVWFPVGDFSARLYIALVCNRLVTVNMLIVSLLAVCMVHCALGLFATSFTLTSYNQAEEHCEAMASIQGHDGTSGNAPHENALYYGTFEQPLQGP